MYFSREVQGRKIVAIKTKLVVKSWSFCWQCKGQGCLTCKGKGTVVQLIPFDGLERRIKAEYERYQGKFIKEQRGKE